MKWKKNNNREVDSTLVIHESSFSRSPAIECDNNGTISIVAWKKMQNTNANDEGTKGWKGEKEWKKYQWNQWINCVIWRYRCVCAILAAVCISSFFDLCVRDLYVKVCWSVWHCAVFDRLLLSVKIFRSKIHFPSKSSVVRIRRT